MKWGFTVDHKSENDFLISENDYLISENGLQKGFSDIKNDIKKVLISENRHQRPIWRLMRVKRHVNNVFVLLCFYI